MQATVAVLSRYPVKSMLGEALQRVTVGDKGPLGDRAWAVIDAILSRYLGRDVALAATAPDDRHFEEVWPDIDGLAPQEFIQSTVVGQEPTGEAVSGIPLGLASPPGTFFDLSLLHILTTSTLERLAAAAPTADFDWRRYRPNLLVDGAGEGFVENAWSGRTIRVGEAAFSVSMPTMRCVMTTLAQPGLPEDRSTLRTIAGSNRIDIPRLGTWACAGVYADVVAGGTIAVGDPVTVD